jgi:hypothetical protein
MSDGAVTYGDAQKMEARELTSAIEYWQDLIEKRKAELKK